LETTGASERKRGSSRNHQSQRVEVATEIEGGRRSFSF
jgi:hypothetical protein